MTQLADLNVSGTHPLALEFTSLRTTVARFQAWSFRYCHGSAEAEVSSFEG
jgi:hypothetical protein